MSIQRLPRCVAVGLAVAAVGPLAAWVFCSSAAAADTGPKPIYDGTPIDEELTKPPIMEMPPKWDSPKREKMVKEFMRKLGHLKPYGDNKKKDLDDCFLLATGDVDTRLKSADVRFMVLKGLRKTAEFLVDYIAAAPAGVLRKWHVFARFKEEGVANQALASARIQYDRAVAYRKQLERIYRVLSTRRC
jgi:hypothetical protein